MNDAIKKSAIALLNESLTVSSWGISDFHFSESAISFNVSGFLFSGNVTIRSKGENYLIRFDDSTEMESSLDELVMNLDCHIEKGHDYEKRIETWLKSN